MHDEIHEKSPNETYFEFLAWMINKSFNDNQVISGKMDNVVYRFGPDPQSIAFGLLKFFHNVVASRHYL